MKNFYKLNFLCCLLISQLAMAGVGVFEGGVTIDGTTYWEAGSTLQGQSFMADEGTALNMTFAYAKTYKNSGDDVCSARLSYAVYPSGGTASFIDVALPFAANLANPGNQEWSASMTVNLISTLAPGTYTLAVFYSAEAGASCPTTNRVYLNNSSSNYTATITVAAVMAVDFLRMDAFTNADGQPEVQWTTANEINHDHFEVERSVDALTWATISQVTQDFNRTPFNDYTYIDAEAPQTALYYRIAAVDLFGEVQYSSIAALDYSAVSAENPIVTYPNPVQLRLFVASQDEIKQVTLYNQSGQSLMTSQDITNGLDVSTLDNGLYILQVHTNQDTYFKKLLKN